MSNANPVHDASRQPVGYCAKCQARLGGEARCTECGHTFDWNDPGTYLSRPQFSALKFWFPGFCLAVASGVIAYAIVMRTGEMGVALFVSVPVSFGTIIGYCTRGSGMATVTLGMLAVITVAMGIMTFSLAGFFCGTLLAGIFVGPALCGLLLGISLRYILSRTTWSQRRYLPVVLFLLLPYGTELIENWIGLKHEVATVETGITIDASAKEVWRALMFYEDVQHAPPFLLKLALPKPIRSEGRKSEVGDVVRCIYDRGRLCKQVIAVAPERKLKFKVVEQDLHFEHDVKLLGGSFELIPLSPRKTQLVLTTRYERLCWPEWFWGPIERKVIHTLHEHVMEGIEREIPPGEHQPPETEPPSSKQTPLARSGH